MQLTLPTAGETLHLIRELAVPGFELRAPIVMLCQRDGEGHVAQILQPAGIDLFGTGPTAESAREDLTELLCEALSSLSNRRRSLAPHLARELRALEGVLVRRAVATPVQVTPMVHVGLSFMEWGLGWRAAPVVAMPPSFTAPPV
jgi:hypothetical protein